MASDSSFRGNAGRRAAPHAPRDPWRRRAALRPSASPPCQRIASRRLRARPSWRKSVWPLTVSRETDTPERRRSPLATAGLTLGAPVGEPVAHVVEQEVGIRPDQLKGLLLVNRIAAGDELGSVTADTICLVEQAFAFEHARDVETATRRHAEIAAYRRRAGRRASRPPRRGFAAEAPPCGADRQVS